MKSGKVFHFLNERTEIQTSIDTPFIQISFEFDLLGLIPARAINDEAQFS